MFIIQLVVSSISLAVILPCVSFLQEAQTIFKAGTATSSSSAADLIFTNVGGTGEVFRIAADGAATFSSDVSLGGSSLNFTKADGVNINAKESLVVVIDSDNNDAGRVFQVQTGAGTNLVYNSESVGTVFNEDSADLDFRVESNNNANMLFVDGGNDHVNIGTSSDFGDTFNVSGTGHFSSNVTLSRQTNDAGSTGLVFEKTRSTSVNGNTVVQNGDQLGYVKFTGNDGDQFIDGAYVIAFVEGTPGNNDMPTSLQFWTTADGASSPTARMTISNSGAVTINSGLTVGNQVSAQDLTLTDNTPTISMTDTDSNADTLIFTDGGTGTGALFISADHNDEVAGSYISLKVDAAELAQFKASEVIFNEDSRDQTSALRATTTPICCLLMLGVTT